MLPSWMKRLGLIRLIIVLTLTTIIVSLAVTTLLNVWLNGEITLAGAVIGTIVPLVITPTIGFFFFRVLFELDEARAQLELLSVTDDLTKVYNRRYFIGRTHYELARARRYGHMFSMLLIDLDDFKQINDEFGHPAGDQLLKMVADVFLQESREVDVLARLGGDEFGFLIPGLAQDQAVAFADRLREKLARSHMNYRGKRLSTTASVGVISWGKEITDLDALIFLMDKALYAAKTGGKNKTVVARLGDKKHVEQQAKIPAD